MLQTRTPHTLDYAVGIEDLVASARSTAEDGGGAGADARPVVVAEGVRFIPSTLTPTGSPRQSHLGTFI